LPKRTSKTPKGFSADLTNIFSDRTGGASSIETAALDLLLKSPDLSVSEIITSIRKLCERFPLMANFLNLCEFFEKRKDSKELYNGIKKYRQEIEADRGQTIETCSKRIARYKSIFTLSNSGLIRDSLVKAHESGWEGTVLIAESRPRCEGTILGRYLAKKGLEVVLMVDSAIPDMLYLSGAVFLGADAVTEKYFINKNGSRITIDYAANSGKPVFVVADKSKFISSRKYRFHPDKNPPEELAKSNLKSLHVVNSYFEKVIPSGNFRYITGKTIIVLSEIANIIRKP